MPLPSTRFFGSPENFSAAKVSTSTGLVTIRITASGATVEQLGDQRPADLDVGAGQLEPGLAGLLLGTGGDRDDVGAGADRDVVRAVDVRGRAEQQAVPQVEHLRLDLVRVHVVEHDVVGHAADQAGVGQGRADRSGTDDGHLVPTNAVLTHG